jgi:hypothetical protein
VYGGSEPGEWEYSDMWQAAKPGAKVAG